MIKAAIAMGNIVKFSEVSSGWGLALACEERAQILVSRYQKCRAKGL